MIFKVAGTFRVRDAIAKFRLRFDPGQISALANRYDYESDTDALNAAQNQSHELAPRYDLFRRGDPLFVSLRMAAEQSSRKAFNPFRRVGRWP